MKGLNQDLSASQLTKADEQKLLRLLEELIDMMKDMERRLVLLEKLRSSDREGGTVPRFDSRLNLQ